MKLSIIIPCYNCEKTIAECLDSVLKAISAEDEVLCVDDGSSDRMPELLRGFSDPRIRVITQKNGGPGAARNTGIEAASGDQILFVDSDDVITPPLIGATKNQPEGSLLKRQLCLRLTRNRKQLEESIPGPAAVRMTLPAEEVKLDVLNADRPSAREVVWKGYEIWGPVVKTYCRSILTEHHIRFPDSLRWGEDICFNLQYLSHIDEVSFIPVKAYWYRPVSGSLINGYYPEKNREILRFLETAHSLTEGEKEEKAFSYTAAKQYFYILQADFCNPGNLDPYRIRRQKAWQLETENPLVREGIRSYVIGDANPGFGLVILMLKLKCFLAVDLSLKLRTVISQR